MGATHEKSFGCADFEVLVRNPRGIVQPVGYVGLKLLRRSEPEAYMWELSGYR